VGVGDQHVGAFLQEDAGNSLADAGAGGGGDDGGSSIE
jgi:hypothetical protein